MSEKVTENTLLGELLKRPGSTQVLSQFRLPCLSCPMAALEMGVLKIGDVARMYGIDLSGLLKELNKEESETKKE
jgi:hypothetical protein